MARYRPASALRWAGASVAPADAAERPAEAAGTECAVDEAGAECPADAAGAECPADTGAGPAELQPPASAVRAATARTPRRLARCGQRRQPDISPSHPPPAGGPVEVGERDRRGPHGRGRGSLLPHRLGQVAGLVLVVGPEHHVTPAADHRVPL